MKVCTMSQTNEASTVATMLRELAESIDGMTEAVRLTPLERLLVETDAPYLAPIPYRGKRNEPAYVVETARKVAELKGVSFEEIVAATTENWRRLCLQDRAINR